MWTILLVITVGSSQGGVTAHSFGEFHDPMACQAAAQSIVASWKSNSSPQIQCVKSKDKP